MTNEELAVAIQAGQTDLLETLWGQVELFVKARARVWNRAFRNRPDFDDDDLAQCGWFALLDAVKYFNPEKGMSFIGVLALCLKRQFSIVAGINSSKRDATFFASLSLDMLVNSDEPDGSTIGDTIPDPASAAPFEALEDASEREQMRATLDTVAGEVLTPQQREVYRGLLNELRCATIATDNGVSRGSVWFHKEQVLEALRGDPRILQLWLDLTDRQETVEEIAIRYAAQSGVRTFKNTGASSVERAMERILQARKEHRVKARQLEKALEDKLHEAGEMIRAEELKQQRRKMSDDLSAFESARAARMANSAQA